MRSRPIRTVQEHTSTLQDQLASLPTQPGIYQFKDSRGDILYVGKAKSLRSRVRSYFRQAAALDAAKRQMVPKITALATIVTDTENEALILEANLIRQHRPPYNVILTDDKYYLFIKITTGEKFPRVFPVRRLQRDHARYFGPYSSARAVRHTLKLLRRLFPYRIEKDSPHDVIFPHPLFARSKGTLRHSTDANLAEAREEIVTPQNAQKSSTHYSLPTTNYQHNVQNIIRFLQGDRQSIIKTLRTGMQEATRRQQFERAAIFRDQLSALERLEGHQKVFLPRPESFDVISVATQASRSAANVLAVRRGRLINKNVFLLKHHSATSRDDILRQFLLQYYRVSQDIPSVILIPHLLSDIATIARWINKNTPPLFATPQRGKKRQLLAMGQLNAEQLLATETVAFAQASRLKRAVGELFSVLGVKPASAAGDPPPRRIETYDISNIQGKQATGSLIVFTDGQPTKSGYRKFRITTKDTPDDYHMLQEVLHRRFSGRHANWPHPDLLLIDGGVGQLNTAHKILAHLKVNIPVAAIAKREEILFTYTTKHHLKNIRLPYDSDALYLVQRMRDEAHRFGLAYHRLLRSRVSQRSLLDEIPGLGPRTKKKLLSRFGSLKNIRAADDSALIQTIGPAKTKNLRNFL